ncbi:J domain-containing protein [Breoghania sp. L-A4]|uniref:J domain-containing protein n=1 Tax=Breoghania sp. L-A4 TaxID=2304600 RepID=UPI000E35941B|nr:J domain-containing protein [Breoghania sp. L-A4]AXS42286.1 molecular chaperone DnaJ [Breoghania sp. L-A4]
MKLDSKIFDSIRIKGAKGAKGSKRGKQAPRVDTGPMCQWEGCDLAGPHRAPKGRGAEGQYLNFCIDHVREYNKSYNYFDGMNDTQVRTFQKDALTGHRPTWRMGVDEKKAAKGPDAGFSGMQDPFSLFDGERATRPDPVQQTRQRKLLALERRSLGVLNLDGTARGPEIKARYKELVKLHHPDANGGDRSSEDQLSEIIKAYNILKQAGLC